MNKELGNTSWEDYGADGEMSDDGPITPIWSEATAPKAPEKKPESAWDSLSEYARRYNESVYDKMYDNYSAMNEGYLDAEEATKAKAAEAEEKTKWVKDRSWAKMVHWYKNHPSDLTDIMFADSEHDEAWYRKHPEAISDLTRDYLAKERALAEKILAENDGLIDKKAAIDAARRQLNAEYADSLKKASPNGYMGDTNDKPNKTPTPPTTTGEGEGGAGDDTKSEKLEIGDIELDKMTKAFDEEKNNQLASIEKSLDKLLPDLAELYAKNRRLIIGRENKDKFNKMKSDYGNMLNDYLSLKANKSYNEKTKEIGAKIESRIEELQNEIKAKLLDFAGGDLEKSTKTQAELDAKKTELINEANRILTTEYGKNIKAIKAEVNAGMIKDLLERQIKMENATIDALDNGTICRKIVHKVLNNPAVKGVLVATGLVALGVATAGVATGAVAIGLGYTAGGIALGATKGGLGGALMSRQDSGKSAIRGFSNETALKKQFQEIDLLAEGTDSTANVAKWIMSEYSKANESDLSNNRKKTAISAGIGAIVGGAMSGIHFTSAAEAQPTPDANGVIPEESAPQMPDIVHKEGTGMNELFREMGGQGDLPEEILQELSSEYGLELGQSGWTFPGSVSSWPARNQAMAEALFQKCIARGWISPITTPTQAVFDTATQASINTVPNQFFNFIVRGLEAVIPAGIGGIVGGFADPTRSERPTTNIPVSEPTSEEPTSKEPTTTEPTTTEPTTTEPTTTESAPAEPETTDATTTETGSESGAEPTTGTNTPNTEGSTTETEIAEAVRRAERAYDEQLERAESMLGGRDNVEEFFRNKEHTDEDFLNYWQSLSEDGKTATRYIFDTIPDTQDGIWRRGGSAFKEWFKTYEQFMASRGASA